MCQYGDIVPNGQFFSVSILILLVATTGYLGAGYIPSRLLRAEGIANSCYSVKITRWLFMLFQLLMTQGWIQDDSRMVGRHARKLTKYTASPQ